MFYPFIPVRLHGWLDDFATLIYLVVAWLLEFSGAGLAVVLLGAFIHFANTRCTNYPQGTWGIWSLRTHTRIEFLEGIVLLSSVLFLAVKFEQMLFLYLMGIAQVGAALFGETKLEASNQSLN